MKIFAISFLFLAAITGCASTSDSQNVKSVKSTAQLIEEADAAHAKADQAKASADANPSEENRAAYAQAAADSAAAATNAAAAIVAEKQDPAETPDK